jgi:hypothetical protein
MTNPIRGQQAGPNEEKILQETAEHWRKVWNEAPVEAIARAEEAARQLIAMTTGLQGLYIAILAFSNIRAQADTTLGGVLGWLLLLLFFTPPACWLVSLFYATRVFVPRVQPDINLNEVSVSAWQKVKDIYGHMNREKLRWLHRSHLWLITSFIFVLLIIVLLISLPPIATGPTQIIIVTPTP